jgi:hypothetical protein
VSDATMIFPASEIYRSSQKVKLDTAFHLGLFCFLEIEGQGGGISLTTGGIFP